MKAIFCAHRLASSPARAMVAAVWTSALLALGGCASKPVTPDWLLNAQGAAERAVTAYLEGKARVAQAEATRLRGEVARTGDLALLARTELLQCAAHVASLDFAPCSGFDAVQQDASAAGRAYARYLTGVFAPADVALLPSAQQAPASALQATDARRGEGGADGVGVVKAVADPLSRLVAAGVWFRAGQGSPALMDLAADTASEQGWSRPLLAWLEVHARHAEATGDRATAERAHRRIDLVLSGRAVPKLVR